MTTEVVPVTLSPSGPITAGNDYAATFTLTKNNGGVFDVDGATITCSIQADGGLLDLIADHDVTISDGPNGVVILTLTGAETLTLNQPDQGNHLDTIMHFGDVKVVKSGAESHHGPFKLPVRRAIT